MLTDIPTCLNTFIQYIYGGRYVQKVAFSYVQPPQRYMQKPKLIIGLNKYNIFKQLCLRGFQKSKT